MGCKYKFNNQILKASKLEISKKGKWILKSKEIEKVLYLGKVKGKEATRVYLEIVNVQ